MFVAYLGHLSKVEKETTFSKGKNKIFSMFSEDLMLSKGFGFTIYFASDLGSRSRTVGNKFFCGILCTENKSSYSVPLPFL